MEPTTLGFFVANQQQQPTYLPQVLFIRCWSGGRKCMFLSRALLQYSSVVKQAFHFISFIHSFIYYLLLFFFNFFNYVATWFDYPQRRYSQIWL
jgi:hypothetical protein